MRPDWCHYSCNSARGEQETGWLAISQMWGGRREETQHTCFTFSLSTWWELVSTFPIIPLSLSRYLYYLLQDHLSIQIIVLSRFLNSFISVLSQTSFLISIISIHSKDYLSKQVSSNLINISAVRAKCIELSMQNWGRRQNIFRLNPKILCINNEDDIDIDIRKKQ